MNYRRELDAIFEQVRMHELTDFMGALEAVKLAALTKTIAEAQLSNSYERDPRPDYTTAEVAAMFRRSQQTVRDWIKDGLLDAYKWGREYRITPESLQKFIREQREPLKLEVVRPEPNLGAWRTVSGE